MNNSTLIGDYGWPSVPVYILYIIQGSLIGGSNLIIVITVLRFEALRNTKGYLVMMALSLADTINMTGYVLAGVRRIHLVLVNLHHTFMSPWQCLTVSHSILWLFGDHIASTMLLAISVDRLLAVSVPLKYIKWSTKYALILLGTTYGYTFVTSFVLGLGLVYNAKEEADKVKMPAKCFSGGYTMIGVFPAYVTYYKYAAPAFALVSVVLYVYVWFLFKKSQATQISDSTIVNSHQNANMAQQRHLTVTLGISAVCTVFFYSIPHSLGSLLGGVVPDYIILCLYLTSNVNAFCNIFIYTMRHGEMREAIIALFKCKSMPSNIQAWKANKLASKRVTKSSQPRSSRPRPGTRRHSRLDSGEIDLAPID